VPSVDLVPADFAQTGLTVVGNGVVPTRYQVIGERSSGTNYVKRLLGRNTPLNPVDTLGWKHGPLQPTAIPPDLVVVLSLRNAVDWALSMFAKPWHTSVQMQELGFADFLRAPWETIVDHRKYFANAGPAMVGQPLQHDRNPESGAAFDNLFHLRRGKLAAHLTVVNRGCSFVIVRHESVINDPQGFLTAFRSNLGLQQTTEPLRPVLKRLGARFVPAVSNRPSAPAHLSTSDRDFLRSQLDLKLEQALGYTY
jgi:hypothetical protein